MKVGIILPLAESARLARAPSYAETRDHARQAEAAGFDSVWVYDHLLHRFPGRPTVGFWEAWTVLAALAEATERVELGTSVLCASFRNPALLAKMAVTLDEVSGGRLILGLGAGWHEPEFAAFGVPFDHRVSRFAEAIEIVCPLLRTGRVDVHGTYHRADACELRPRGPRASGPPIMMAAFGQRMLRLAALHADSWNIDWLGKPADPAPLLEHRPALEAACREVGRDPSTLEITGGATIAYSDLGDLPSWLTGPDQFISGPAEEVAAEFRAYDALGVSHLLCSVYPHSTAALARLGDALGVYRHPR